MSEGTIYWCIGCFHGIWICQPCRDFLLILFTHFWMQPEREGFVFVVILCRCTSTVVKRTCQERFPLQLCSHASSRQPKLLLEIFPFWTGALSHTKTGFYLNQSLSHIKSGIVAMLHAVSWHYLVHESSEGGEDVSDRSFRLADFEEGEVNVKDLLHQGVVTVTVQQLGLTGTQEDTS